MAEPLAFANDGSPLGFAFLVELIDILDRPPVGMWRVSPSPKKPLSMPLQANRPTWPLCEDRRGLRDGRFPASDETQCQMPGPC